MNTQNTDNNFTDLDFDDVTATEFGADTNDIDLTSGDDILSDVTATVEKSVDTDATAAKKRKMVFYGLVAVVLLAAGGFFAMTFLGKKPDAVDQTQTAQTETQAAPTAPTPDTQETLVQQTTNVAPQQPSTDQLIGDTAGENLQPSLFENSEAPAQPIQTTDAAPAAPVTADAQAVEPDAAVFDALAQPETQPQSPMTTAVPPATNEVAVATPELPVQTATTPWAQPETAAPTVQAPAPSDATAPAADPLAQIIAEAPTPDNAPNNAPDNTVVNTTPTQLEPVAVATPAMDDSKTKELEEKIASLEENVADLTAQLATAKASAQAQADKEPVVQMADEPAATPVKVKKASVKKSAPARASVYDEPYRPTTAAPSVTSANVELRGVSGTSAVLSIDGKMRQVQVGDQVPQLGRITSIERGTAGWVVQGTSARVSQ